MFRAPRTSWRAQCVSGVLAGPGVSSVRCNRPACSVWWWGVASRMRGEVCCRAHGKNYFQDCERKSDRAVMETHVEREHSNGNRAMQISRAPDVFDRHRDGNCVAGGDGVERTNDWRDIFELALTASHHDVLQLVRKQSVRCEFPGR